MASLKRELKNSLEGSERVAILGIGSLLRGDDALGLLFIDELKASLKKNKPRFPLKLFSCGVTPENFTGEIKRFKPSLILIIDAVDMAKKAGQISVIDAGKNTYNVSFSTHGLPIKLLVDYLTRSLGCRIIFIGIQPKSAGFDLPVSSEVSKAIKKISRLIMDSLVLEN
jgi:hydrogenase 3 maturation protease